MPTNAENLVKISLVHSEIFGGICQIILIISHRYTNKPYNLWRYWTEDHQIVTRCSRPNHCAVNAAIGVLIFQSIS